ncbi:MAG TPA: 16S rRNA (guanine(966)-N(2))-methyltransferase RsmD [Candidatus Gastranaerophilales bacterium]|nr:16S rRNA (guanine(966)-N(2))-methyltransferase RsmD [Candidatus Gastranaerophilales bacterium]
MKTDEAEEFLIMIITAGKYKGKKIKTNKAQTLRPTSSKARESVFNIVMLKETGTVFYEEETRFLDLFAGSGIMGLEALSRGANKVVFVEKNPETIKILKQNISQFENQDKIQFFAGDSLKILNKFNENEFNFIFIDPPYKSGLYEPVLKKIKETGILKNNGIIIIEHAKEINAADIAIRHGFKVYKTKTYGDTLITVVMPSQTV